MLCCSAACIMRHLLVHCACRSMCCTAHLELAHCLNVFGIGCRSSISTAVSPAICYGCCASMYTSGLAFRRFVIMLHVGLRNFLHEGCLRSRLVAALSPVTCRYPELWCLWTVYTYFLDRCRYTSACTLCSLTTWWHIMISSHGQLTSRLHIHLR